MTNIQIAKWEHYGAIIDMLYKFTKASPYSHMEIDESKASDMVIDFIENPVGKIMLVAANDDNEPIGILAATTDEILFSRDRVAHELVWWIEPEYRKSTAAKNLMSAYEYWAKNIAKAKIIQLATVETDQVERIAKLYNRRGYRIVERVFIKEI